MLGRAPRSPALAILIALIASISMMFAHRRTAASYSPRSLLLSFVSREKALPSPPRMRSVFRCAAAASPEYDYHVPVMLGECCEGLQVAPGGVYVDCTLGGGGHTKEILRRGGLVIGLDQDPDAVQKASSLLQAALADGRLEIIKTNFRNIRSAIADSAILRGLGRDAADGMLMDLGISSWQIDEPQRGFSYSGSGPLDMRMGRAEEAASDLPSGQLTAQAIVNEWDGESLANVLFDYGGEVRSRQIAREIINARPLLTTQELEKVISRITPFKVRPKTLSRCFQALRIVVNDEMAALDEALASAHHVLRPGGRLAIMSYHSLEDRRVKDLFLRDQELGQFWSPLHKRPLAPTPEEVERNPVSLTRPYTIDSSNANPNPNNLHSTLPTPAAACLTEIAQRQAPGGSAGGPSGGSGGRARVSRSRSCTRAEAAGEDAQEDGGGGGVELYSVYVR